MGFFKNKKHNTETKEIPQAEDATKSADIEPDDFDEIQSKQGVTREDFHKMANENLKEALDRGIAEIIPENSEDISEEPETAEIPQANERKPETENASESIESETENEPADIESETEHKDVTPLQEDVDDFFDGEDDTENETVNEIPVSESEPEIKKEKKPRMTFSQFREKYKKAIKAVIISLGSIFSVCLVLYIYGCATVPKGVMGRNIYIENVNVSNLTYDEALSKVKSTSLLNNCNITVVCKGQMYSINGIDVGLTARIEDTVDKAMQYGKTGNVLVDGFVNTLQLVTKHTVMPSANVNEKILRDKLCEFGNIIHGELLEHKLEVGDGKIICTPGHTGFSGNTDAAYEQVINAINNEDFSRIRVELRSAPPKTLTLEDIDAFAYATPKSAYFDISENNVTVVPEVWGRYLNREAVAPLVSQIYEGGSVVNIPYNSTEPDIKASDLNEKLFNATLGSFYTNYGGSTANRAANVANAASKINNKVLAPGEVFSFNDTVGKRSVANGFFQAPEYANGQTVMGIGGGTCQVSSTLYNAVLYSDLSIVSRLNHMFPVGYCPLGQDATVTDSGVDFKFANNTDYPIKISALTSGARITVSILGTQRDVPHTVKIENYTTHSEGNQSVRSYRMVYDPNGTLIRKDDLGKSYYMAH